MNLRQFLIEESKKDKVAAVRAKLAQAKSDLKDMSVTPNSEAAADAIDGARNDVKRLEAELASLTESTKEAAVKAKDAHPSGKCMTLFKEKVHPSLLKESPGYDVNSAFDHHTNLFADNVLKLQRLVQSFAQRRGDTPSWSDVGSVAHVNEALGEVIGFLEGEK